MTDDKLGLKLNPLLLAALDLIERRRELNDAEDAVDAANAAAGAARKKMKASRKTLEEALFEKGVGKGHLVAGVEFHPDEAGMGGADSFAAGVASTLSLIKAELERGEVGGKEGA